MNSQQLPHSSSNYGVLCSSILEKKWLEDNEPV